MSTVKEEDLFKQIAENIKKATSGWLGEHSSSKTMKLIEDNIKKSVEDLLGDEAKNIKIEVLNGQVNTSWQVVGKSKISAEYMDFDPISSSSSLSSDSVFTDKTHDPKLCTIEIKGLRDLADKHDQILIHKNNQIIALNEEIIKLRKEITYLHETIRIQDTAFTELVEQRCPQRFTDIDLE